MVTTKHQMTDPKPSHSADTSMDSAGGAPLSFTQESLWLADKMSRQDGPAYNEPTAFRVTGKLRVDMLRQALHEVVKRHDALHTGVIETGEGLRAVVQDQFPEFVDVFDLREVETQEANTRAAELVVSSYCRPFDLAVAPLLRVAIVLLPGDESIVALTLHHMVTDGWSNALILDEIRQHYLFLCASGEPAHLPAPAVRYSDYAFKIRQDFERGAFDASIEGWKEILKDGPELLRIPADFPPPPRQTFAGSSCSLSVPGADLAALFDMCRLECRSTKFTVLLAAYAVLLNRYTGQDRVAIGTTVLNRSSEELLDVVGCFVNTVPLVFDIDEDMTFRELLARVENISYQMLKNGDAPYLKVLGSLGTAFDADHNPVFQTMLTLLGERPILDLGQGISCKPYPVRRVAAKYEVLLYVSEYDGQVEFEAEFNTDLFSMGTIERTLRHYALLLTRLAANIDAKISRVSFLPAEEKKLIFDIWNKTQLDYPDSTVIDLFESQAAQTPGATAVEFEDRALTYDGLNRLTNQVAHFLAQKHQESAPPFIGVYMERSLEMVVALLAIVKAGLAYVPIDPEYPAERISYMIENAQLALILTQQQYRTSLASGGAQVVVLDITQPRTEDDANFKRSLSPDSPVYMIYTSGSTGRPKGVVNRHVSLFNRLYWMQNEYHLTHDDRILQKTPFSFDVSVWEFFWPLMFGARLVVARPGGHRDADYLKRLIHDRQITTLHFVPSMLNVFLEEEELAFFCRSLRRVICSGEALLYRTVERFYATLTCGLHNLYGPTEAAIDVSYWPCSLDYPGKIVPIGRPIANIQLYVVDKHLHPQPVGVPGELCIGGVGLAAGYYHRDDLTQKSFVRNPFSQDPYARLYRTGDLARFLPDGLIQYLGRIDTQVKLRGLRIELEEIRAVLLTFPEIKDAAVILRQTGTSQMLVGYMVANAFDPQSIKEQLRKLLPEYMIPQVLIQIPAIPLTANGKLDRRALPDPPASLPRGTQDDGPTSQEEVILTGIWADVLGQESPGVNTNFFRYGGDSILSIRVVARLRELGYAVEVQDVFAHPTIRELAEMMKTKGKELEKPSVATPFFLVDPADRSLLAPEVEDAWPLTMLQSGMIYHTLLEEETSVYHDIFDYGIAAPVQAEQVREAWRLIVSRHPQLRSVFDLSNFSRPLQVVYTSAEVSIEIADLSGLPRQRQDEIIQQWIAAEKRRGFDMEHGPLARVQVHVRSREEMNLAISFHHAILDGWSISLVLEEFRRTYADLLKQGSTALVAEQTPYSVYVHLEQQAVRDPEQAAFWSERLNGFTASVLPHFNSGHAAGQPAAPASIERLVPQRLAAGLQAFASGIGIPARSLHLALHLRALGQILGESRVVSGLVTHGRPETLGSDALAGLFLNTVPFPIELMKEENWPDFARWVFQREQNSVAYRRFPLAEIQRLTGVDAWFDTVFNYTDFHLYRDGTNGEVRFLNAQYFEYTSFDAVVHVHHDYFADEWRLLVNYNVAQIATDLIERYLDSYLAAATDLIGTDVVTSVDHQLTPPTELERQIVQIVSQAIGVENLGIDDNYLDLGMDSITAIQVVARIKKLSSSLTMKDIFAHPTVRKLAQQAANKAGSTVSARGRAKPFELAGTPAHPWSPGVIDAYPATSMQIHMIHKTNEDQEQATYHDVFSYRLAIPLKEALLRDCVLHVVNRYDILRTGFSLDNGPVPMQLVYETVQPKIDVFDLSILSLEQQKIAFSAWFEQEKRSSFDWANPGLMRFAVHRWNAGEFTLTVSFHHSIIDGWSLSLFIRELVERYAAELNGAALAEPRILTLSFRDYVKVELESREAREQQEFWRAKLRGHRRNLLPRLASQDPPARWSETKVLLEEAHQAALSSLCARLGVPMKHVMLAAHLRVVNLVCQEADVLTGVFTSGRLEEDDGEQVLGLFLNFLPFRQQIAGQTWRSFIQETFANDRQSLPYRRYPLANIERDLNGKPLFETLFNYTRFKAYSDIVSDPGRRLLTEVQWFEHTAAPLLVNVGYDIWQERGVITLNADGRVLSQESVDLIGQLYVAVLAQICERVDAAVIEESIAIRDLMAVLKRQDLAKERRGNSENTEES
ncbi:MAG TPA: amino acid adenylation domain-containing protein [Ktedonobacteraceae bacterium]|nr:amino acid adenylation domain-containing protein [Ktedonobacteraceae bacterium]